MPVIHFRVVVLASMAVNPSELSVAELRRRFLDDGEPVSAPLLKRLRRDPRRGVRELHQKLARRRTRQRERRLHLDGLLHFERVLWRSGIERLAGVDEAGCGPLAGPVVAAAVIFPAAAVIEGIDDSKRLDPGVREVLAREIRARARAVAVGLAAVEEIDRLNIYRAALLAMRRAVEALPEPPQHLLVDARQIPGLAIPQNTFNKGDGINYSIAAASIIAKTHRDRLMEELDRQYPGYGFARHKGYCTAAHQEAIRRLGPSPVHRTSFTYLRELCGEYCALFYELQNRLGRLRQRQELAGFEAELADARSDLSEEEYRKLRLTLQRRWDQLH